MDPVVSHYSSSSGLLVVGVPQNRVQWVNTCSGTVGTPKHLLRVGASSALSFDTDCGSAATLGSQSYSPLVESLRNESGGDTLSFSHGEYDTA